MFFLHKVAKNKKNAYYNEWKSNHEDNTNALTNRKVVNIVIVHEDKRAHHYTYCCKDDAANKFPFPRSNKEGE